MAKHISPLRRLAACALATLLLVPALPPAQAAGTTGTHYHFEATAYTSTNRASLSDNLIVGSAPAGSAYLAPQGKLFLPQGMKSIRNHYVANGVNPSSGEEVEDATKHYGLPYRTYEYPHSDGTTYYKVVDGNLELTLDLTGKTIEQIRIWPNGKEARAVGAFNLYTLDVNTWTDAADFAKAVPADRTYTQVDEDTLRAIAVDEAERTASITYSTTSEIKVPGTANGGSGERDEATVSTIPAGSYTGPIYKRGSTYTREMLQSVIEDGVYAGGHGKDLVYEEDKFTGDDAIVMDCQTFVYNAISRVSRTNAWSVANVPMATRMVLLGDLTVEDHPAFTNKDIVEKNPEQAMYENYAAAKAGDVIITYNADRTNSVHTRLVSEVHTTRNADNTIDPDQSYMLCHEQAGGTSGPYSHVNEKYYFRNPTATADKNKGLIDSNYVAYTLTEYADEQVENAHVQAVVGSMAADTDFLTGGANVAISSNYRVISYRVTLESLVDDDVAYDSGLQYVQSNYNLRGLNYQNDELDAALASLPHIGYAIKVAVDSGPVTTREQDGTVPHTEISLPVSNAYHAHSKDHSHSSFGPDTDWIPLSSVTDAMAETTALQTGNYYLDKDIYLPANTYLYTNTGATVNLCLNGHDLYGADGKDYILNAKGTGSVLNICDCSADQSGTIGKDWNGKTGGSYHAALMINGTNCQANLYGGSITGIANTGSVVYVKADNKFNMYGGSITGNNAVKAGAVEVLSGSTFTMSGGEIAGNTVMSGKHQISGTGLGSISISGTAHVEGYHKHSTSCSHDAFSTDVWGWKPLSSVTDNMKAGDVIPTGNYYLDKDITLNGKLVVSDNVNLCLNGKNLTGKSTAGILFHVTGGASPEFNICDCSADQSGTIGKGWNGLSDQYAYSVLRIQGTTATVNLYGGSITGATSGTTVYVQAGNTFNMHGGKITDNTAVRGGTVQVTGDGATFNMIGGSLTGNTYVGSQIVTGSNGVANITGGTVDGYHSHSCGHDHTVTGAWTPLSSITDTMTTVTALQAGNYYLDKDITLADNTYLVLRGNANLCLNGYNLNGAEGKEYILSFATGSGSSLNPSENITLNICDCSESQTGTMGKGWQGKTGGEYYAALMLNGTNCTANLYAGTITGASAGSMVYIKADNTFNMHGGAITDNTAVNAGAVHVLGTFNWQGGSITDNDVNGSGQVTGTGTINSGDPNHKNHNCSHNHLPITGNWTPLSDITTGMTGAKELPAGNYYLDDDITISKGYLQIKGKVNLCLNGHNINGSSSYYIFATHATGAEFNICDCSPAQSGTIGNGWTGSSTGTRAYAVIRVGTSNSVTNSTVNLYGGSITGATNGSIVYVQQNNTFNMYGGSMYDNTPKASTSGHDIDRQSSLGKVFIYGGEFDRRVPDAFIPENHEVKEDAKHGYIVTEKEQP